MRFQPYRAIIPVEEAYRRRRQVLDLTANASGAKQTPHRFRMSKPAPVSSASRRRRGSTEMCVGSHQSYSMPL